MKRYFESFGRFALVASVAIAVIIGFGDGVFASEPDARPATRTPQEYADACESIGGGVLDIHNAEGDLVSSSCLGDDGDPIDEDCNWETSTCSDPSAIVSGATGPTRGMSVTATSVTSGAPSASRSHEHRGEEHDTR